MTIQPDAANEMLIRAGVLADSVRSADTLRQNVYRIQALVVVLCVAPFDLFNVTAAVSLCVLVITSGVYLTFREIRRSQVINREAMTSYTFVIVGWSVLWAILMTLVGPWLSDQLALGWTLTGLIGSLPFLLGIVWERRR